MTSSRIAPQHPLGCLTQPHADVHRSAPDRATLTARAGDDLFADPSTDAQVMSASLFTFETTGDFQFRAKVKADFQEKLDSGMLVGYFNDQKWFKICAEIDPLERPRVATVVANDRSDDANSTHLVGEDIHLCITRTGITFALRASSDGSHCDLARYFALNEVSDTTLQVGIAAQWPAGDGNGVIFSEFGWRAVDLSDPRGGRCRDNLRGGQAPGSPAPVGHLGPRHGTRRVCQDPNRARHDALLLRPALALAARQQREHEPALAVLVRERLRSLHSHAGGSPPDRRDTEPQTPPDPRPQDPSQPAEPAAPRSIKPPRCLDHLTLPYLLRQPFACSCYIL